MAEDDLELTDTVAGREVTPVAAAGAVLDPAEVGVPEDAEDTLHHIPADLLQGKIQKLINKDSFLDTTMYQLLTKPSKHAQMTYVLHWRKNQH